MAQLNVGDTVTAEWTWGGHRFSAPGVVTKISGKTVKVRLTEHAGEHFTPGFVVTVPTQNVHKKSNMKTTKRRSVQAPRMDAFTRAYFEAALWSSNDESDESGGEPLDKNYGIGDFDDATRDKMIDDCADFQQRFAALLADSGLDDEKAGHNFWLSRNGHGSGFFDDDLDELQEAAKSYGEFYLYVGDDGAIYGPPPNAHGVREGRRGVVAVPAASVNFQNGERVRIRVIGPKGQLADPPFWYAVTGTMSVEDVALQFTQTLQPGMFVSISDGKNSWTFQKETHGGQNAVRRTHKLPTARYREASESHHVADFNTLDDLIAHARDELGATHVLVDDANTKLYFPRGGQHSYEEASVWRKSGYWHAQGPGARTGVHELPEEVQPIGGGQAERRAAEVARKQDPTGGYGEANVKRWMRSHVAEYVDPLTGEVNTTKLAEGAAYEANRSEWLDDSTHPIWDWALEEAERYERAHRGAPGRHTVRDYIAVDRRGRTTAGPFKTYGDAKSAAGPADVVQFVSREGVEEARRSEAPSRAYIIEAEYPPGSGRYARFPIDQSWATKTEAERYATRWFSSNDKWRVVLLRERTAEARRSGGGRQATKPGKHGTLHLWRITYKDSNNPAFGEASFQKWAYDKQAAWDDFNEEVGSEGESWEIVKIEPILDTGPKQLSREARRTGGTRGGPARKYYVVDQVQNGIWVQVGHFATKDAAERFRAKLHGQTRIHHAFPSGHDHPPIAEEARRRPKAKRSVRRRR